MLLGFITLLTHPLVKQDVSVTTLLVKIVVLSIHLPHQEWIVLLASMDLMTAIPLQMELVSGDVTALTLMTMKYASEIHVKIFPQSDMSIALLLVALVKVQLKVDADPNKSIVYNCSTLELFGSERCDQVWGGENCQWTCPCNEISNQQACELSTCQTKGANSILLLVYVSAIKLQHNNVL